MNICYIGLGGNLNVPRRQLILAVRGLSALPRTIINKKSRVYCSPPWGFTAQPGFCNMVVELNTSLAPEKLLEYLQLIEHNQLRTRKIKWGPRTIDLDILLYGNLVINTSKLIIPHPHLLHRDFVLQPLKEIAPQLFIYDSL